MSLMRNQSASLLLQDADFLYLTGITQQQAFMMLETPHSGAATPPLHPPPDCLGQHSAAVKHLATLHPDVLFPLS